jgi:hypothetical protein
MPRKVLIVGGHGLGDCLLSLQCAKAVKQSGNNCDVELFTRDEIFNPLNSMFGQSFALKQNKKELSPEVINALTPDDLYWTAVYDELYFAIPDWLFSNPRAFDWKKYGTNPQVIKTTRLLLDQHRNNGVIYLGLMTSTQGYLYSDIEDLAINLAKALPEYTVYLPIITKWAGQTIKEFNFPLEIPKNLIIEKDPNFTSALFTLRDSVYFIGTDNGPSHVAYHLGVPRLILDPQYNKLPWVARWKEDPTESVPISTGWPDVVKLVKTNLEQPPTLLIPRSAILANIGTEWKQALFNKF